ncbi:MAG: hypothetical protein ABIR70_21990 [Bryobacteraceae bacterium]
MSDWPDDKIRSTALRYITKHLMDISTWRATTVGVLHPGLGSSVELQPGESPIVSCFHSAASWYVLSTRRILATCKNQKVDAGVLEVTSQDFSDFKGHGGSASEVMNLKLAGGQIAYLEFETGKASMAPIYFFRYWEIKYPILGKLRP